MPASCVPPTRVSRSHDNVSPTSGIHAITQGDNSNTRSSSPSTTMRSNPATANPVTAPVIAASTTTWCERRANSRKRRVVSPGLTRCLR